MAWSIGFPIHLYPRLDVLGGLCARLLPDCIIHLAVMRRFMKPALWPGDNKTHTPCTLRLSSIKSKYLAPSHQRVLCMVLVGFHFKLRKRIRSLFYHIHHTLTKTSRKQPWEHRSLILIYTVIQLMQDTAEVWNKSFMMIRCTYRAYYKPWCNFPPMC